MIDFTHKKRPEFIQLVLIMAVVCLALGAITPAASAVAYDWEFIVSDGDAMNGTVNLASYNVNNPEYGGGFSLPNAIGNYSIHCGVGSQYLDKYKYAGSISDFLTVNYSSLPKSPYGINPALNLYTVLVPLSSNADVYFELLASWLIEHTDIPTNVTTYARAFTQSTPTSLAIVIGQRVSESPTSTYLTYDYSDSVGFGVGVSDSGNDYLISVSGIDGSLLAGSAYTIAVSTYSGGYNLPLTSFPMYLGDSPVHFWTTDQTFTLPIYLSDGVTPIDYYCVLSFPADPTATGYPFWWNMTTHGSSEYPFNTTYPPVVLPTPTPLIPSDIIPHPDDLNNTINITGWYQEQGFEGNNITAPIYSGLRGFFTSTLIPFYDFFLTPIGSLASMISDSAGTSKDAIYDSVEQLMIYAAPMNMVGGYVVELVPAIVWVVVFAALTIGYAVLLIRISTGSIRDTISRFLGRW